MKFRRKVAKNWEISKDAKLERIFEFSLLPLLLWHAWNCGLVSEMLLKYLLHFFDILLVWNFVSLKLCYPFGLFDWQPNFFFKSSSNFIKKDCEIHVFQNFLENLWQQRTNFAPTDYFCIVLSHRETCKNMYKPLVLDHGHPVSPQAFSLQSEFFYHSPW